MIHLADIQALNPAEQRVLTDAIRDMLSPALKRMRERTRRIAAIRSQIELGVEEHELEQ